MKNVFATRWRDFKRSPQRVQSDPMPPVVLSKNPTECSLSTERWRQVNLLLRMCLLEAISMYPRVRVYVRGWLFVSVCMWVGGCFLYVCLCVCVCTSWVCPLLPPGTCYQRQLNHSNWQPCRQSSTRQWRSRTTPSRKSIHQPRRDTNRCAFFAEQRQFVSQWMITTNNRIPEGAAPSGKTNITYWEK